MKKLHAGHLPEGGAEYWTIVNPVLDAYEAMPANDVLRVFRDHYERGDRDTDHLEALGHLPARNPEHAAAVYRAFAESPDPDVRGQIILYLSHLSLVERAAGFELWDHLVRDPNLRVREDAICEIEEHLQGDELSLDPAAQAEQERARQERVGLTWQNIAHLYRAHRAAERNAYMRYRLDST